MLPYKTEPRVTLKSIANNPEMDIIDERLQPDTPDTHDTPDNLVGRGNLSGYALG